MKDRDTSSCNVFRVCACSFCDHSTNVLSRDACDEEYRKPKHDATSNCNHQYGQHRASCSATSRPGDAYPLRCARSTTSTTFIAKIFLEETCDSILALENRTTTKSMCGLLVELSTIFIFCFDIDLNLEFFRYYLVILNLTWHQVHQDADNKTITQQHRKQALRWHPDKHHKDDKETAQRQFVRIQEAYEVPKTYLSLAKCYSCKK